MASGRERSRGCRSVALPRIGDATAATAAMLAKPPRTLETGEGSTCCNHGLEAIPIMGDPNERAGDATAATAAMLTTSARASETVEAESGEGRAVSSSAGSASVTCCGANQRAALCDDTACCCDDMDECSTELVSASCSGRDCAAMADGVGITLGERGREDMVYT